MEINTNSLEQTKEVAAELATKLSPQADQAVILTLFGDLGAGKTSFTQGLAQALGVEETVASPTFVIEKIYDLPAGANFRRLVHIDAYRLDSGDDLEKLDWARTVADPDNLIIIEWPERVAEVLPGHTFKINFKFIDDTSRQIEYGD
jgi:tRNA threonylcarbamoyl adenosine modification protein YjeE